MKMHESTHDGRDHLDSKPIHNGNMLEWWTGTDRQLVRYERAGRANALLVMEDDTTRNLFMTCAPYVFTLHDST
jgi:hypothetical protein